MLNKRLRRITIPLLIIFMIICTAGLSGCKKDETKAQTDYRISKTEVSLDKGKTTALMVLDETQRGKPFTTTWSSENPAVVTVENKGFITGVAAGVANITAEIGFENSDKKIELKSIVTIVDANVPLENIAFGDATVEVFLDSTYSPEITFFPANSTNKNVTFTSDNEDVISFDPITNTATAKKLGTATITAVSEDGSFEATQSVKVVKPTDEITSFKLDQTSITVGIGAEGTITPVIEPATVTPTVTWASSDTKIATVENGVVKGLSKGKVTITATVQDRVTIKTAKCTVTVSDSSTDPTEEEQIPATKVTFDKTSITVYEGDTGDYAIKATVTPENTTQKGQWSSSNSSVVSVDSNGKLTICSKLPENKNVSVTITYKIGDVSARALVVVKPKNLPATELSLNKSSATMSVSDTLQLSVKMSPENTNDTVEYSSSNDSVATVNSDGKVTAVGPGTATITAKTTLSGITATCNITVNSAIEGSISINLSGNSEIKKGSFLTATIALSPNLSEEDLANLEISMTSSNPAVQVSKSSQLKFTITAEAAGSATVTCKVTDKSGRYKFGSKEISITVTETEE